MNTLMKENHTLEKLFRNSGNTFFGRTIDDILSHDFFSSFDANIHEEQDAYRLEIAVPGMTRKDITIRVEGTVMWVSAQKQKKSTAWHAIGFNEKHFQRSFTLPKQADTNNIRAKCRNGLLRIKIGKIKSKGMHRIIKVSGERINAATTTPDKITFWWNRLMDKGSQIFTTKN